MPSSTPSKKTPPRNASGAKGPRKAPAGKPPAPPRRTPAPRRREAAARPAPEQVRPVAAVNGAVGEAEVIAAFLAGRRRLRRLLALKVTGYVMVAWFLASTGLAVWQLTVPSLLAGVYVGLATLSLTATGVCIALYQRHKDG
nr:hypothetical protein OG461_30370 [Streptomyces sp. NBC_00995]